MRRVAWLVAAVAASTITLASATTTHAASALLYSWEGGLEGWTAANATLANSNSLGVTNGTQSLLLDNVTSGFKNDVGVATVGSGSGAVYSAWASAGNRIAAGDTDVKLEFDFTFDHGQATPGFAQLAIFVNSSNPPGFKQYGTGSFIGGNIGSSFPTLDAPAVADGVTMTGSGNTRHISIPLNAAAAADANGLIIGPGGPTQFYQVGFKSNGGWGGTVDWAIDNMRVTGARVPEPSALALLGLGLAGGATVARRRR